MVTIFRGGSPLNPITENTQCLLYIKSALKKLLERRKCIPAAQSTAMPLMPFRPIPDVTILRNPEPSGLIRLTPL